MQKKNLETVLYSAIGVVVMAVILIAFNILTGAAHERVDLTKDKAYTLSEGTRAILGKLDTPVKIRFYCTQSENATPYTVMLKSYAQKVEDLLAEYKQASHGKLVIEKLDPQPDSDAEDSARLDGIDAQNLPGGERFYLGLAVSQLDAKEAIPFLSPDRERELEYDLSRAISRVVTPEKPVVGVMSALPVFGQQPNPMMMQMGQAGQGQEPWTFITELRNDFTVKHVEMDTDKIDDDIKVLVVIHPKEISDAAQYAIDQFVLRGGKLIAFLDASSQVDSQGQNGMQMPGGGSSLPKLLKAWGIDFENSKVVADRTFKMVLGDEGDVQQQRPVWLALTPEGINSNDIATAELDNVWYFSGGAFTGKPAAGVNETVLLHSSPDSQLVDGMLANFSADSILKDFKPSGTEYALAVRLTGKFKTAFPEGKPEKKDESSTETNKPAAKLPDNSLKESAQNTTVVLIGDADMIYDGFTLRKMNTPFGNLATPMNGNLNFAQNLVEQLSGDNNLIAVRSRTAQDHPFTRVKKIQAAAEAKYLAEMNDLQKSRDEAIARLNELQQQKSGNQKYILSPEQQAEIEKLRKQEGEVSGKLRQVNKDLRRDVVSLQRRVEWINILAMPLAVSLAGIALAIYKRKRTSAK